MLRLLLALVGFPFFLAGCIDFFVFAWGFVDRRVPAIEPIYLLWLVAALWLGFVISASDKLETTLTRVGAVWQNLKDRVMRRRNYHPDKWWHDRYPGDFMISFGERHPSWEPHFEKWKADMIAKGYGPKRKDPGVPQ